MMGVVVPMPTFWAIISVEKNRRTAIMNRFRIPLPGCVPLDMLIIASMLEKIENREFAFMIDLINFYFNDYAWNSKAQRKISIVDYRLGGINIRNAGRECKGSR